MTELSASQCGPPPPPHIYDYARSLNRIFPPAVLHSLLNNFDQKSLLRFYYYYYQSELHVVCTEIQTKSTYKFLITCLRYIESNLAFRWPAKRSWNGNRVHKWLWSVDRIIHIDLVTRPRHSLESNNGSSVFASVVRLVGRHHLAA